MKNKHDYLKKKILEQHRYYYPGSTIVYINILVISTYDFFYNKFEDTLHKKFCILLFHLL